MNFKEYLKEEKDMVMDKITKEVEDKMDQIKDAVTKKDWRRLERFGKDIQKLGKDISNLGKSRK